MYVLSVCLRQSPTNVQFHFKDFITANAFRQRIRDAQDRRNSDQAVEGDDWLKGLLDDYHKECDILLEEIGAIILADPAEGAKSGQELAMIQTRAQMEFNAKVANDPKLKFLAGQVQLPPGGLLT